MKAEATDDGYIIHTDDGKAVCRVKTKDTELVTEATDISGQKVTLAHSVKQVRVFAQDNWLIHPCAGKLTFAQLFTELPALLKSLSPG